MSCSETELSGQSCLQNEQNLDYIYIMHHHPVKLMIFKPLCHSDPLWRFDGDVPKASHLRKHQHSLRLAHLHRPTHVLHNSGNSRDRHAEPRGLVNRKQCVGSWGAGRTSRPPPDLWGAIGPRTQRGSVVIMLVESKSHQLTDPHHLVVSRWPWVNWPPRHYSVSSRTC